jgi:hypothetical protein
MPTVPLSLVGNAKTFKVPVTGGTAAYKSAGGQIAVTLTGSKAARVTFSLIL